MKAPICPKCNVEAISVVIGSLSGSTCWVCPKCKKEITDEGKIMGACSDCTDCKCEPATESDWSELLPGTDDWYIEDCVPLSDKSAYEFMEEALRKYFLKKP